MSSNISMIIICHTAIENLSDPIGCLLDFTNMSSILDFRGLYFCAAYLNLTSGKQFKKNFYYVRTRLFAG